MTFLPDIILIVHSILYLLLVILPYIISKKTKQNIGIYLSWFMTMVIISWLLFKKCLINNLEGDNINKYGSIITFINKFLKLDTGEYSYLISLIITLLYCYSAYYLADYNIYHQYFIIILTISMVLFLYK